MFIGNRYKQLNNKILVIADSSSHAKRLEQELRLFAPLLNIAIFSDTEILPYERISPTSKVIAGRLKTLWGLVSGKIDILITSINTIQTKVSPKNYIAGKVFDLHINDQISLDKLRFELVQSDYTLVDRVYEAGEFSIRGNIIDLMPMGSEQLVRIELFDNTIEQISLIDALTHKALNKIESFTLIPTHEYSTDETTITNFKQKFKQEFPKNNLTSTTNNANVLFNLAGINAYLPLFFEELNSLFDYLDPHSWHIIYSDTLIHQLDNNWHEITRRYNLFSYQYPCLSPSRLYEPSNQVLAKCNNYNRSIISTTGELYPEFRVLSNVAIDNKSVNALKEFRFNYSGFIVIVLDNAGAIEILRQNLTKASLGCKVINQIAQCNDTKLIYLIRGSLSNGFITDDYTFISESELYTRKPHYLKYKRKTEAHNHDSLFDLSQLNVNDYIVHQQHGIGRYLGLKTQSIADIEYEMLEIEYLGQAKLFIPIDQLDMLSKYSKVDTTGTTLSKLGNPTWNKLKTKAQKNIDDLACHLLDLYARRQASQGYRFKLPQDYKEFELSFGYEATPDQEIAFKAIIEDMTGSKPMDRLICGDVGFGKTEVALRAAFIAVANNKQVALLVPTTLLAEQMYQKFCDRFAGFNINIAEISRFRTAKEISQTINLIKNGEVNIVIGTHRLIQKDIAFASLGLVIIDEEHRFGVKQKEKLKHLYANIDFLAMTATPIPRTLSMALEGLREFSIIATPPKDRLAVTTLISKDDNSLIREAILRELRRGGQVYFLYNDVASIDKMYQRLSKLMPEASIAIAHGQMHENTLETTIRDFIGQKYQILLCSTIIETGIDIANVNTILIYHADKLGLAGLHQLRGRVGRSHHQAYCYLIVPDEVSSNATKRLEAIQLTNELGAGFNLAIHDLEIRGAGEILGDNQSGNIKDVGLALYTKMLKSTINKLTKNNLINLKLPTCEVTLNTSCILPSDYCFNTSNRLIYYKRLSNCNTLEEVNSVYTDIINDNGLPPVEVVNLIHQHELRIKASHLGIKKIKALQNAIHIEFDVNPNITPDKLLNLLKVLKDCKYDNINNKLVYTINSESGEDKYKHITTILNLLNP